VFGGELGDEVGVEPFLGGDPVGGVVEVDAFEAGGDAGAFGVVAGVGGVGAPEGADVVGELQVPNGRGNQKAGGAGKQEAQESRRRRKAGGAGKQEAQEMSRPEIDGTGSSR
jgi:hypothetical protein